MVGSMSLTTTFGILTLIVPVATYFLILGILNSRRHPQMLTGRQDFALLITALSPMFAVPALGYLGVTAVGLTISVCTVAAVAVLLAPRGRSWVIYNIGADRARELVGQVAESLGLAVHAQGGPEVPGHKRGTVRIGVFAPLRNVTVRVDAPAGTTDRFERQLSHRLGSIPAETSPMAVVLMLVATGMLALPLSLTVGKAAEIVRLIGDLLD